MVKTHVHFIAYLLGEEACEPLSNGFKEIGDRLSNALEPIANAVYRIRKPRDIELLQAADEIYELLDLLISQRYIDALRNADDLLPELFIRHVFRLVQYLL